MEDYKTLTSEDMMINAIDTLERIIRMNIKYERYDDIENFEYPTYKDIPVNEYGNLYGIPSKMQKRFCQIYQKQRLEILQDFLKHDKTGMNRNEMEDYISNIIEKYENNPRRGN